MGYVPKFIHLDHFISVEYPFGVQLCYYGITNGIGVGSVRELT